MHVYVTNTPLPPLMPLKQSIRNYANNYVFKLYNYCSINYSIKGSFSLHFVHSHTLYQFLTMCGTSSS